MTKLYRVFVILLLAFSMVITSCKKEEEIIEGCTEINAMNYLANATSNDGSCIFAYDIAQGFWDISSQCDDLEILGFPLPLNDVFPETVEIKGEGGSVISIDINGDNVFADVEQDGIVTIQNGQKISLDTGVPLVGVVDVDISGSGNIASASNGNLTLNLSFEVPLAGTQSSSCEIMFTK